MRKKKHESKVRLLNKRGYEKRGQMAVAEERMGKEDGGLARHSIECTKEIDWQNTRILRTMNID